MSNEQAILDSLPSREVFPETMPRYPNVWFVVDPRLAVRPEYRQAVLTLAQILEKYVGLRDTFAQNIDNSALHHAAAAPGEGSDFQARIGPLQHHVNLNNFALSHWHQLHARFYAAPLYQWNGGRSRLRKTSDGREFFLVAASVHYEVATEDPLHPYEDECPLCGITGDYHLPIEPESQDYCEKIHDPLGVNFFSKERSAGSGYTIPTTEGSDASRISGITSTAPYKSSNGRPMSREDWQWCLFHRSRRQHRPPGRKSNGVQY